MKKRGLFIILIFAIFITINLASSSLITTNQNVKKCGDETFYNTCSLTKPYFCLDGKLIPSSETCGCPEGFTKKQSECVSNLEEEKKEITLEYVLRGEKKEIAFTAYNKTKNELADFQRSITYEKGELSSRADFKLKSINDESQKNFLLPLVISIQNTAKTKEDQARIAISIVQNIPFGYSNQTINFGGQNLEYARRPYETLYENQGVCGEKTDLLAFLLKELGYGVAFFYFPNENHEALGIKCPIEESLKETGYCLVETTAPSIINEKEINYVGVGKLTEFEVFLISEGMSFPKDADEYKDAKRMNKIRKSIQKNGRLNIFLYFMNKKLEKKYGLEDSNFNP